MRRKLKHATYYRSLIRWRAADPGRPVGRWTRVHVIDPDAAKRTICGLDVPEHTYLEDRGDAVPLQAVRCEACAVTLSEVGQ